ncbi:MAG TPA: hypothetical protein P5230_01930 [Candidatus Magasanikbacteria bacterium]|nr:hypothetical protein [Candidatus Magasanikbacteria bacterium]
MPYFSLKLAIIIFCTLFFTQVVLAASEIDRQTYGTVYHDVTSTQFQIKGGVGDPAVGRSTSSNYIYDHGLVMEFPVMTITIDPTVNFGEILPDIPTFVSSSVYVTMPGSFSGYNLSVKREDPTSTLDMITNQVNDFPDYTSWNPSGSGNATTTPGNNLSFRVKQTGTTSNFNSAWWGSDDTILNAKYGGFPAINSQFMQCLTCNWGTTVTVIDYRASAPLDQKSGSYDGVITITALANI